MLHNSYHFPHLFHRPTELNGIYASVFIMNLAESFIGIFVPIFLFSLNYSIPAIILFYLLANVWSVLLALPIAHAVAHLGPKHAILLSTPFLIIYFLGLHFIPTAPALFWILPLASALRSLLYNFGFETNFTHQGKKFSLGKTISALQIVTIAAGAIAPAIAGVVAVRFGFPALFSLGALLLLISVLPLFFHTDYHEPIRFTAADIFKNLSSPAERGRVLSFVGYAIESSIGRIIWPLFLFSILSGVAQVGWIATVSTVITVIVLYAIGKATDKYRTETLLKVGTAGYFIAWVVSTLADSTMKLFFIESYRRISERFLLVPWSTLFYRVISPGRYFQAIVARDMVFNISRLIALPLLMVWFTFYENSYIPVFLFASACTLLYSLYKGDEQK